MIGGSEAITWTEIVKRTGQVIGRELPLQYVLIGTPIALMPYAISGLLHFTEMVDYDIDKAPIIQEYHLSLTPMEEVAKKVFGVAH